MTDALRLAIANLEDMVRRHACGDRSEAAVTKARDRVLATLAPTQADDATSAYHRGWHDGNETAKKTAEALAAPSPQQAAGGEAQSDLPPPDSAYWVNHDVTSPYTERAKPADTPYNLGWMSGWAAHGRAYPEQAAPAAAAPSRGQKLVDAGYTRRPSFRSLPPDEEAGDFDYVSAKAPSPEAWADEPTSSEPTGGEA